MVEQAIEISTLVVGITVMACRRNWITITDSIRDKVYILLKGVLVLYLTDLFLLLVFDIPFPALHESSPVGIAMSIFIILIEFSLDIYYFIIFFTIFFFLFYR